MSALRIIFRPWYWLAGKIFAIWARPSVLPDDPATLLAGQEAKVCYVLETGGLADTLALERICRLHGLPSPSVALDYCGLHERNRIVVLRRKSGFIFRKPRVSGSARLQRIVDAAVASDGEELLLIPVAIYWGRSPDKEQSLFKLLFSEDWDVMGRTRKFFATLIHGRNTLLQISRPLPLSSIINEGLVPGVAFRKLSRVLRVHFRQRRTATVGPDLSHRGALVNQVLLDPRVRRAIEAEAGDNRALLERTTHKARRYAFEIAANISYPTIRMVERFLDRLWTRIYDGIVLTNVDKLRDVARDCEVIYVPCHRSHIDYLLLGYIVYNEGLSVPHTAAGINLNMPIIGAILRRGGAFFLRRTFKGNRLYATVFNAYLNQILTRGYPIEYFVEGGRSRTGRLLPPKAGMLAMTVDSWLRNPRRRLAFMPIYFGYEKLIEGDSFIRELSGAEKKKETLLGLIRSIKSLRENFGKVYVNIGEPVRIEPILEKCKPDWQNQLRDADDKPEWVTDVVNELGNRIMIGINSAAAVTPISLLATVLLSTPKQTIGEMELHRQLNLSIELLKRFRYADSVTIPEMSPGEIVDHGERLGVISRTAHPLGDVVHMAESDAVLMTYFRNNINHLLAVPASIACCFIQGRRLHVTELQRLLRLIYPFMQRELCVKWRFEDIDAVTTEAIGALVDLELLTRDGECLVRPATGSASAYRLLMLGQIMVPMLQRFYLAIALLVKNGPGTLTRTKLETLCQKSAQRLSMIYGLNSPDFFDKALFQDFVTALREQDVLRKNAAGFLEFDDDLESIGVDARLVLGEDIRHSILSLTLDAPGIERL